MNFLYALQYGQKFVSLVNEKTKLGGDLTMNKLFVSVRTGYNSNWDLLGIKMGLVKMGLVIRIIGT